MHYIKLPLMLSLHTDCLKIGITVVSHVVPFLSIATKLGVLGLLFESQVLPWGYLINQRLNYDSCH